MPILKTIISFFAKSITTDTYTYKPQYTVEEVYERLKLMSDKKYKYSNLEVDFLKPTYNKPGINFEASFKWGMFEDNYNHSAFLMGYVSKDAEPTITIEISPEIPIKFMGMFSPILVLGLIAISIYTFNIIPTIFGLVIYLFHRKYVINAKENMRTEFERSMFSTVPDIKPNT